MASSSNDEYVDEENVFLSMLDELHKPDEPNKLFLVKFAYYVTTTILSLLQVDLPHLFYWADDIFYDETTRYIVELTSGEEDIIEDIIGKIATEIAMSAVNDVDIHTTTLAILKILQCFCWETKLIFTVVAYITTYGDMGLNLCPKSKAFTSGLPNSIIKLLRDDLITTINKSVEYVQRDQESAGIIMGSHVEAPWIHFKIAVYQAIKVIVEVASSHLMTRSTLEYKCDTSITTRWNAKHEVIIDEYLTTRKELLKVLQLFEAVGENSEFRRLKFEIDAVKPETLEVNVIDQQLVVKGDRNNLHGPFDQRFQLPNDTRKEEIKAKFGSGILWIDLPKIHKFGQKNITIPIEYL